MKTLLTTTLVLGAILTLGNMQSAQAWEPQSDAPANNQDYFHQARWYGYGHHWGYWGGPRYYGHPGYYYGHPYYWGGYGYYPHCGSWGCHYYGY